MSRILDLLPFGALLKRELVVHLRRRSSGSGLIVLVGLAIGGVWLMTATPFPRGMASIMFTSGLYLTYFVSFLLVPTVAATSIASERQNQTLDLLQLTLLRASGVVIAKMLNAVGYFLLLCVGVLPVFGVIFFYVGVDISQFLQGVAIILAATLAHAAIGVAASASQRSPMRAITRAIALTVFWSSGVFIGLIALAMSFTVMKSGNPMSFVSLASCVPWFALTSMVTMGMMPAGTGLSFLPVTAVLYQLVVCALALAYATFSFRRTSRRNPPADVAPLTLGRSAGKGATRWISDRANPIYVKEIRTGFLAMKNVRWLPRMRATYVAAAAAFLIAAIYFYRSGDRSVPMAFLSIMLATPLALIAPTVAAASLVRERTSPTYELLSTTLATPRQIVFGHAFAAVQGLVSLWVSLMLGTYAAVLGSGAYSLDSAGNTAYALACCLLQFPVLVAIGAWAGVLTGTVSRAIILSYAVTGVYVLLPGIIAMAMTLLYTQSLNFMDLPRGLREYTELLFQILSSPVFKIYDEMPSSQRGSLVAWSLLYHAVIWVPIVLMAGRILANSQRNEARLQKLLNRTLLPKEF